jgi:pre-mRNA-splicing factor CWC22
MEASQIRTVKEEKSRRLGLVDDDEGVIHETKSNGVCFRRENKFDQKSAKSQSPEDRGYDVMVRANVTVNEGGNGGVYMPPAKRKQLLEAQQEAILEDTNLLQRQTWQDQKRAVHGTVNRLNESTIKPLIHELFLKVNLLRLRGVLTRSLLQAAVSSPRYSQVYAALVAVLNTKLPEVGELVVKRAILAFRRHYRLKEKAQCLAMAIFLGHLFHQAVVHELIVLQILTLLLDGDPTDDSVEVAVQFMTVVGQALLEVSPAGVRASLERLRALLHEGNLNKRVEYKMEQLLKMRQNGFRDHPPIPEELDLVDRDDQITFELTLDDEDISKDDQLDVFHLDNDYKENEAIWAKIQAEILGTGGDNGSDETDEGEGDDESDDEEISEQALAVVPTKMQHVVIQDLSEADLIHLRRQIYLTIMSSASFEECAHKLTKINIPVGRESELINMIIECTSQERTFLRYYGLISARFCLLERRWSNAFMEAFVGQYTTIHRLETNKLRNVAKLFAHLLHTDSMSWSCLGTIHLNEDETTSSSRIFVKILIQEMAEAMGIATLKERFETDDPELLEWYKGMFPRDNVRNTRYAINFFTSIGLGPLTDGLREFLKNAPKLILAQAQLAIDAKKDDDDEDSSVISSSSSSSSFLSSSSSSSSDSDSSSSSSSSYSQRRRQRRRRQRSSSYTSSSDSDVSTSRKDTEKRHLGRTRNNNSESRGPEDSRKQRIQAGKGSRDNISDSRSATPDEKNLDGMKGNGRGKHNERKSSFTSESTDDRKPRVKEGKASLDASQSSTPKDKDSRKGKIEHESRKRIRSQSYSSDDSADGEVRDQKRLSQT